MNDKIYAVETLCSFKHTYFVRAKEHSHALDEVVCNLQNPEFIEGSQLFIEESIMDSQELTEEEFLKMFNRQNSYLSSWSNEQKFKMINQIDYGEEDESKTI